MVHVEPIGKIRSSRLQSPRHLPAWSPHWLSCSGFRDTWMITPYTGCHLTAIKGLSNFSWRSWTSLDTLVIFATLDCWSSLFFARQGEIGSTWFLGCHAAHHLWMDRTAPTESPLWNSSQKPAYRFYIEPRAAADAIMSFQPLQRHLISYKLGSNAMQISLPVKVGIRGTASFGYLDRVGRCPDKMNSPCMMIRTIRFIRWTGFFPLRTLCGPVVSPQHRPWVNCKCVNNLLFLSNRICEVNLASVDQSMNP